MNYDAERAMNQKRLRMEGEAGHGVVQGNGLPLNYMDNGHQIPYQPYAGAYNTHYPPPDAFSAYGPPPPGGYAPQNLSYAPPAHQNYPHHQSFQQQQAPLHMAQPHMVQGYGPPGDVVHKPAWPPQPHLLPPLTDAKPIEVKPKPEIKLEPAEGQKRPHVEADLMGGDLDQPKIKIKTDIFKPDDALQPLEAVQKPVEATPVEKQKIDEGKPEIQGEVKIGDKPTETLKSEVRTDEAESSRADVPKKEASEENKTPLTPNKTPITPSLEPKKRGRPKGSTNKPKPAVPTPNRVLTPNTPNAPTPLRIGVPGSGTPLGQRGTGGRPRGPSYQFTARPFRKDFSGIKFRRRWSDDCLDSSNIPNEVYFGDVPVSMEVLFNYYDANAEREKLAAQAAQIAAQKAAAAKLAAAKLQARGLISNEITTVDSSSSESSSGSSDSDSSDSDDETPLKNKGGRPKGSKNSTTPRRSTSSGGTPGKRGRPPVPPELREPGVTDMKKFLKAAGIRFDYKKLTETCTKNKERVAKMLELLTTAGLEGKPTLDKCKALKQAKVDKKDEEKRKKQQAKAKPARDPVGESGEAPPRRMTRGATGSKPRQKIVISSEEEDDTPDARRTLSKLRSMVEDESDSE